MKRVLKVISLAAVLTAAILFCGCDALLGGAGGGFSHVEGTEYTGSVSGKESMLVIADNGDCSLSYLSNTVDIEFGELSYGEDSEEEPPVFDVKLSTVNEIVGSCTVENGRYTMECKKSYLSLVVEGPEKDEFLKHAKEDLKTAYEDGKVDEEEYKMYSQLLNGKSYNIYEGSVAALVISGDIDTQTGAMTMRSLLQYDTEGRLEIESEYSESGILLSKTRYNESGIVVGIFEYYDDGELKKLVWNYDDGSFMNSEEYIRENGLLAKVIYRANDGYVGTELYKNGKKYREEETDANGIFTYRDYDEDGVCIKFTAITGGNDDFYRIGEFLFNAVKNDYLETVSTSYSLDGTVLGESTSEYDSDGNLLRVVSKNAEGVIEFEERLDLQGRPTYSMYLQDGVIIRYSYDLEDCDILFEEYDLTERLIAISKDKDGVGFYSCHYKEDGSKTEYFADADETLYHYPLKDIEYGPDGNIVKISEYENFFTDSGRFADSCDKKISVYENGELKTVTEYKNEFFGEGYVVSVKEKVTHYKNGEIVNVETFQ